MNDVFYDKTKAHSQTASLLQKCHQAKEMGKFFIYPKISSQADSSLNNIKLIEWLNELLILGF